MTRVAEALVRGSANASPVASKLLSLFWVLLLRPILRIRYREICINLSVTYMFSMSILGSLFISEYSLEC